MKIAEVRADSEPRPIHCPPHDDAIESASPDYAVTLDNASIVAAPGKRPAKFWVRPLTADQVDSLYISSLRDAATADGGIAGAAAFARQALDAFRLGVTKIEGVDAPDAWRDGLELRREHWGALPVIVRQWVGARIVELSTASVADEVESDVGKSSPPASSTALGS